MRINNEPVFEHLFGSELKRKILRFLSFNQAPVSERVMAELLNVSHTAVNKAAKQLLEMNAIRCISIGKALAWELNKKSFTYPLIQNFLEISVTPLDFVKKEITQAVHDELERINKAKQAENLKRGKQIFPKLEAAYIFGSVAEGTARPDSDIDVLVILEADYENQSLAARLQSGVGMEILDKTGNCVSFHIYDARALERNSPPWLKDAVDKGIKVY